MAVTELIESGIALKKRPLACSQKGNQPGLVVAGRSHDGSERLRILLDADRKPWWRCTMNSI